MFCFVVIWNWLQVSILVAVIFLFQIGTIYFSATHVFTDRHCNMDWQLRRGTYFCGLFVRAFCCKYCFRDSIAYELVYLIWFVCRNNRLYKPSRGNHGWRFTARIQVFTNACKCLITFTAPQSAPKFGFSENVLAYIT